jgi:hypothetical protein
MVKAHLLLAAVVIFSVLTSFAGIVKAQREFHLEQEAVKIWINQDGTIDLFYNISIRLDSGDDINFVNVGQPKPDFTVGEAKDQYGNQLAATYASEGDYYKVRVLLNAPLEASHTIWFTLITRVSRMIYEDKENAGNVGMQFIPVWWSVNVSDLRVSIVLPQGVNSSNLKTSVNWTSFVPEENGTWSAYWERRNLLPDQQFPVGVSFPKQFVQGYESQPSGINAFFAQYGTILLSAGALILIIVIVALIGIFIRKAAYLAPSISMESLGIRRGLTAVEASNLLDMKPTMIITEILYSLLQKRAVWVESTKPSLKLRVMEPFQDKTGTKETPLRYYEIDFLNALKDDGTLDEERLANTIMSLRDNIEQKLRGYCRRDTIDYYGSVAAKAWEQVEQAGTSELASKAYDEQLLWLFLDPNYQARTQTAFQTRTFEPSPLWFWYWYGYTNYHPNPTYSPTAGPPAQATKPPAIPGADFANNIATAIEGTSNNIVVNLEKFANAILPTQSAVASDKPAHHDATCVCACHACACACACVSCACACAGGGVG